MGRREGPDRVRRTACCPGWSAARSGTPCRRPSSLTRRDGTITTPEPWLAWLDDGAGAVAGVALRTPPRGLLHPAAAGRRRRRPGRRRAAGAARRRRPDHRGHRVHRRVRGPHRGDGPAGRPPAAVRAARAGAAAGAARRGPDRRGRPTSTWSTAWSSTSWPRPAPRPIPTRTPTRRVVAQGRSGSGRAPAGRSAWSATPRRSAGVTRIGPVWTPPEHRRHGYAAAADRRGRAPAAGPRAGSCCSPTWPTPPRPACICGSASGRSATGTSGAWNTEPLRTPTIGEPTPCAACSASSATTAPRKRSGTISRPRSTCAGTAARTRAAPGHDDDMVIGFRRLSIIDLEHSHQPLPYDDGRYWLIFNGEIYNYLELRERLIREFGASSPPTGDGEAIVAGYHYWGEQMRRPELRGMFAFLIWDSQERVLFGARDSFGIKPLFTLHRRARHVLRLGEEGAAGAGPGPGRRRRRAGHRGAAALPDPAVRAGAGHACTAASAGSRAGTAFTAAAGRAGRDLALLRAGLPDPAGGRRRASSTARSARCCEDSVAKHMRADVTVGAFLSGGIDSTAIAALAKRAQPEPAHLHHRLRAGGLLRDRRGRRVGRGDRRPARHQDRVRRRR